MSVSESVSVNEIQDLSTGCTRTIWHIFNSFNFSEVDCGWHKAMTCSGCPQFPMWCTKDCFWEIDEDGKDGKCIGKPHFFHTCTNTGSPLIALFFGSMRNPCYEKFVL